MKPTNYTGWEDLQTIQSKEILSELIESKNSRRASLIISDTGLGKSNTIKLFMKKYAENTFLITVGDSFSLNDIMDEMMRLFGLKTLRGKNSRNFRMAHIKEYLKDKKEEDMLIILDEAENLRQKALKAVKELYDSIIDHCSITLIGTDQIITMMDNKINGQSVPQLKRRFKAGTRFISPIKKSRDFKPFFDKYIPENKDLQDLLLSLADNYGELHDYLHPVLTYCSKKNLSVTEELFRYIHKIPSRK